MKTALRNIGAMSINAIRDLGDHDGYELSADDARMIRAASRRGALLWTRTRITTTDASGLDLHPDHAGAEEE